jgi:hypothetical protein
MGSKAQNTSSADASRRGRPRSARSSVRDRGREEQIGPVGSAIPTGPTWETAAQKRKDAGHFNVASRYTTLGGDIRPFIRYWFLNPLIDFRVSRPAARSCQTTRPLIIRELDRE